MPKLTPEQEVQCGPMPSQDQAESNVRAYINQVGLKDPSSAQYRNVRIMGRSNWYNGLANGGGYSIGWLVSFELNAKNSYGAYVGFRPVSILLTPDGRIRWGALIEN
jgi:hypothetical protein